MGRYIYPTLSRVWEWLLFCFSVAFCVREWLQNIFLCGVGTARSLDENASKSLHRNRSCSAAPSPSSSASRPTAPGPSSSAKMATSETQMIFSLLNSTSLAVSNGYVVKTVDWVGGWICRRYYGNGTILPGPGNMYRTNKKSMAMIRLLFMMVNRQHLLGGFFEP